MGGPEPCCVGHTLVGYRLLAPTQMFGQGGGVPPSAMNSLPSMLFYAVLFSVGVGLLIAGLSVLFRGRMPGSEVVRLGRPVGFAFVIAGLGMAAYTIFAFNQEQDGKRRRQAAEWGRYHATQLTSKVQGLDQQVVLLRNAPQSEVAAQKQRIDKLAHEVEDLSVLCERKAEACAEEVREEIGRGGGTGSEVRGSGPLAVTGPVA